MTPTRRRQETTRAAQGGPVKRTSNRMNPMQTKRKVKPRSERFKSGNGRIARQHLSELLRSAVGNATAAAAGLYSETRPGKIARLLRRSDPGIYGNTLVFSYRYVTGELKGYCRLRPDNPRPRKDEDGGRVKYEAPSGEPPHPYYPPNVADFADDPSKEIVLTEGEKKALWLYQAGQNAVGVSGV